VLYLAPYGGAATSVRVIPAYDPSSHAAPYGDNDALFLGAGNLHSDWILG
jgi:hypothetical protein